LDHRYQSKMNIARGFFLKLSVGILVFMGGLLIKAGKLQENKPNSESPTEIKANNDEIKGTILFQKGELLGSLDLFQHALNQYETHKDTAGIIRIYLNLGEAYTSLRQFDQAKENLELAKIFIDRSSQKAYIYNYFNLYTSLDTAQGDYLSAFKLKDRLLYMKDSIYGGEKENALKSLTQGFTEAQIEKQKAVQQITNQRLEAKQKITLLVGVFIVTILLGGIGFLYSLYRNKRRAFQITEKANNLINRKNEELERLNQLKNKLFSIIAHDVRSPLNNLAGVLSLIGQGLLEPEEVQQITDKLTNNVKETTNFLDNLLIWSRSQMNGIQINLQELDLLDLSNETMEVFRLQGEEKKLKIQNEVKESLFVYADREMIRIILRNLVSNAIKFSVPGGNIVLMAEAKATDEMVIISVQDDGIGIKKEFQDRLFGVDNYTTRGTMEEKGSGIGLMLCRDFVERNGGKIWMESYPGKGSKFFFTLPQYHMVQKEQGIKDLLAGIL